MSETTLRILSNRTPTACILIGRRRRATSLQHEHNAFIAARFEDATAERAPQPTYGIVNGRPSAACQTISRPRPAALEPYMNSRHRAQAPFRIRPRDIERTRARTGFHCTPCLYPPPIAPCTLGSTSSARPSGRPREWSRPQSSPHRVILPTQSPI